MTELQLVLLVAAIALAIGIAIGALVFSLRNPGSNKPVAAPGAKKETGLLRVWRDPVRSQLLVGVKGEQAKTASELSAEGLDTLKKTLDELRRWVGDQPVVISPQAFTQPAQPEEIAVSAAPPSSQPKPARVGPVDLLSQAILADVRKPEPPPASIAAQIDEILQEKLAAEPAMSRAVRLLEIPGKGMVVMVGLDQYPGVDDVPDAEVRALIHSAVTEWERRVES